MSEKQRQSSKLLKPRSFDTHKNATVPIIMILGCSEVNTEILDAGMETVESDDCREVLTKMPMMYWPQCEREQDFPTKIDGSLLIHLSSHSVDCVG